jgi:hypothetical protein
VNLDEIDPDNPPIDMEDSFEMPSHNMESFLAKGMNYQGVCNNNGVRKGLNSNSVSKLYSSSSDIEDADVSAAYDFEEMLNNKK